MRIRRFFHVLLFSGVLLLLWQVIVTWSRSVDAPLSAPHPPPREEALLTFSPSRAVPGVGEHLAEFIADKDLFSPTRSRSPQAEPPIVATIPPPSHLKLVGVLLTPKREEAFFADTSQGGKVVRVRKGETIGVYRLVRVTPLQAILTTGQNGEEVSLPLLVLDSGTAARASQPLLSAQQATRRGGQPQTLLPGRAGQPAPGDPLQQETQVIRQNILQLQRRLHQIRRQAARQARQQAGADDEAEEEEEEEEDEE